MRIALNGAEPIDPDAVEAFVAEASRHGFRPEAVFPAFGMAELAIGGSFPPPMRGLVFDTVDAETLEHQHLAKPVDADLRAPAAWPCWASRCRAWRCASPTPPPARSCPSARSASWRSPGPR